MRLQGSRHIFVRTLIAAEDFIMGPVGRLSDTESQANLILKDFLPTASLSEISKEVQSSRLFTSKDQLKTNRKIILHIRLGDLLTSVVLKVIKNRTIKVVLDTALIDENILAIVPDEPKVAVRRLTAVAIV